MLKIWEKEKTFSGKFTVDRAVSNALLYYLVEETAWKKEKKGTEATQ